MTKDPWLLLIIVFLLMSLTLFVLGVFPYPFGILVLLIAVVGRWLQLKGGN